MTKNSIRAVYASPLIVVRLLLFFSLLACAGHLSAAIRYVRATPTGSGDGSNWDNASNNLQAMITASTIGDEVWVAKGTYQRANSGEYFRMKNNVKIYGGFKGDETSVAQRDLINTAHASILQGNGTHVVYNNSGIEASALLDGFTITGGSGDFGGGIRNLSASPTIKNCLITNNAVNYHGAGMYNASSYPILINCKVTGNRATSLGGGVYNTDSAPKYTNCSFSENTAVNGGGIFNTVNSTATLTNCTLTGNTASNGTGGISNNSSTLTLRNSIVYGNSSGINAGDISCSLVQGMTSTDNGNISGDTDPLFVDAANGNHRLQACSPVINRGSNTYYANGQNPDLSSITTDMEGEARFYNNGIVDMGAYEYRGVSPTTSTIHVDASVATPGNGESWATAISSLAEAIRVAHESCVSIDKILVAEGTYYPEYKAGSGPSERHKAFTITRKGLELLGGYPSGGNGTRDPDLHPTIMSGDLGTPGDNSDNAYHVLITVGGELDESLQVDGFTVRDGNADGGNGDFISVNGFNFISNARCGGWYNVYGSPRLNGMRITNNRSNNIGGGVLNEGGNPIVTNTLISENSANQGGGWYNFYGNPSMKNIVIRGNHSSLDGGGWYNGGGDPSVENSLFTGNSTGLTSAVWFGRNGNSSLVNCTVAGNTGNAIMHCYQGKINFRNSIIQDPNDRDLSYNLRDISFAHSIVKGSGGSANWNNAIGTNSGENLDIDPLFVDAANGNYRLQACSPVINKGSNSHYSYGRDRDPNLFNTATDLDGNARFYNKGTVDMGAYEFSGQPSELAADRDEVSAMIERDIFLRANGSDCKLIAYLTPKGASAVSGQVKAKLWVETTQPGNFVKRHYQITPTNGAETATAKVTLYFTQQEFTDFNAANSTKLPINATDMENYKTNLRIEKRSGESDDDSGLPGSYAGDAETINPLDPAVNGSIVWNAWASRWEVSFDVTGFSGFFVKTIDSPLPLNLLSFTGTKEKGANLLNWKTANEVNTLNFEVQSSTDAKNFTKIGTVNASGSGNHQYSYQDATLYHGNVYYRLKMNDRDGSFAYSKIISLANREVGPAMVYPNPAKESITLTVPPTLFQSTAALYDVTGRLLQSIIITTNTQQVSIKLLRSGVYILKLADGTAQRFVKE
ncbi:choice-of-anchor Q domain-containing protein [Dyadobacter sp. 32]|uniref:choice-of-anchor Q domain-containing protein n=1 Tax=Dyadobacter sp. 32 TaxID=538966 RepID=UPI0011EBEB86